MSRTNPYYPTKIPIVALALAAAMLIALLLFLIASRDHPRFAEQLGPLQTLEESESGQLLQGRLVARLAAGRPTAIDIGPDNSLYLLLPDEQKVIRLAATGSPLWTFELRSGCQCGFCVDLNSKPDGTVLLLDMRDDQICEISAEGGFLRRFPLPGSDVSVSFGVVPQGVLVNSLLGDSALAAYDFTGLRLQFESGPAWDTPEQKMAHVLPIKGGWVAVHRHSGLVRLLGWEGQRLATFLSDKTDMQPGNRAVVYGSCSPGGLTTVWCLTPDAPGTTVLQEMDFPPGRVTKHNLPGEFWSLAVAGRTVFAVTRRRSEIWEFQLP